MPGVITGLSSSWGVNKYRNLVLQVGGVLKIETINYGQEFRSTQTRERLRWRSPATIENYSPDLSSERLSKNNCLQIINKKKEKIQNV
jgi:hypothetical protein